MLASTDIHAATSEANGTMEVLASTGNAISALATPHQYPLNRLLIITWQGGRG